MNPTNFHGQGLTQSKFGGALVIGQGVIPWTVATKNISLTNFHSLKRLCYF